MNWRLKDCQSKWNRPWRQEDEEVVRVEAVVVEMVDKEDPALPVPDHRLCLLAGAMAETVEDLNDNQTFL